ncbi:MAG TPA: ComEC/Rec2 family competence protein, partial [Burkholderiaceae bacterium]|nr:ComEC/Rec2 family competence protein [Burkholderiaceae bacterium]
MCRNARNGVHAHGDIGVVLFVVWLASFVAAVSLSASVAPAPRVIALAGIFPVALAVACAYRRRSLAAGLLLACACGAYVGARAAGPLVLPPALATVADSEVPVPIEGVVTMAPEAAADGARLRVSLERVGDAFVSASCSLSVAHGFPSLLPGDPVRFLARVRSVRGLANPGVPDSSLQARGSGLDCFLGIGHAGDLARRDGPVRMWLLPLRAAAVARRALGRAIDRSIDGSTGARAAGAIALLHTAVLGERQSTDTRVEDGFRAAGATHVLSVSGLHLAAVAFVFFAVVRRLLTAVPVLPLWLDPRRLAAAMALPAIAFYTLLSGDAIATVRSALMMAMGLLAIVLRRQTTALVAVAAAVLVLLAWSPLVLFDVSFQLSVVSVLALGLFAGALAPRPVQHPSLGRRVLGIVGRLGAATLAAGATTAPLCAHHFGEITPAAPLGNLLLGPLVEMAVVPFGLGGATVAAVVGDAWGRPFLFVARLAASLALAIADR